MKLPHSPITVQREGDIDETEFSIGNPWILLEHLSKTVYSNVPRVIIQEIGSNARDAHREIGQTRPIRITLPTLLDKTFSIQDWGPGMDPERIHTIFKMYGNSTKRNTNKQVGGFGIGGKTPFAYTDNFQIRTIAHEDNQLVLREYTAAKTEDRRLSLMEMGQPIIIDTNDSNIKEDDKHTGTTISFLIKTKQDEENFKQEVYKVCRFWGKETPEIVNGDAIDSTVDVYSGFEHPTWFLQRNDNYHVHGDREPVALIDGISYPISRGSLFTNQNIDEDEKILDNFCRYLNEAVLYMRVNTGELSISLSREALTYDYKTKTALIKKLKEIYASVNEFASKAIADAKTYREAVYEMINIQNIFRHYKEFVTPTWNGVKVRHEVSTGYLVNCKKYEYSATLNNRKAYDRHDIQIEKGSQIIICDIACNMKQKVLQHFSNIDHSQVSTVFVVFQKEVVNGKTDFDKWFKENNIDLLEPVFMSSIKMPKKERKPRGSGNKISVYECQDRKNGISESKIEIDLKNGSGVYVPIERRDLNNAYNVRNLCNYLSNNELFVAIPLRFVGRLGKGWVSMSDKINQIRDDLVAQIPDLQDIINLVGWEYKNDYTDTKCEKLKLLLDSITDKNSSIYNFLMTEYNVFNAGKKTETEEYRNLKRFCSSFGSGKIDTNRNITPENKKMRKEVGENFVLVTSMIESINYRPDEIIKDLAFFINAKNSFLTMSK